MMAKDAGAATFRYSDAGCELEVTFPAPPSEHPTKGVAAVEYVPPKDRGTVVGPEPVTRKGQYDKLFKGKTPSFQTVGKAEGGIAPPELA